MPLELHVLGPGFGESIVIKTPTGKWGIIVAYRDSKSLSSLAYLQSLRVAELSFLCWTHPDEDHSSGLLETIKAFNGNIEHFWMFSGQSQDGLFSLLDLATRKKFKTRRSWWSELFEEVSKLKTVANYRLVQTGLELLEDGGLTITSLAPADEMIDTYNQRLSKLLENPGKSLRQHNNDISVAILLSYGSLRVVLGGDVTKLGWSTALSRLSGASQVVEMVKASHHGSETDYSTEFWTRYQGVQGATEIVVTPYNRGPLPLPSSKGIANLEQHGQITVTGTRAVATLPADPRWDAVGLASKPSAHGLSGVSGSVGVKLVYNEVGQVIDREKIA